MNPISVFWGNHFWFQDGARILPGDPLPDGHPLHVRRGYARHEKTFRDHAKGKRQLVHKIPSELLEVLKEAQETAETDLVVVPKGYEMIEYSKYRKVLVQFCKEAGITTIATHGLRHSTSELYMEHGATVEDIRGLLGQRDTKTTQRYVHNRGSRLQDIAKVIRLFPECSQTGPRRGSGPQPGVMLSTSIYARLLRKARNDSPTGS